MTATAPLTADELVERLDASMPMRDIFALAKSSIDMPLEEIDRLLDSPMHEARVSAVSIMDLLARRKRTPDGVRRELFELYLRRHDRIDDWDLVDDDEHLIHTAVGGWVREAGTRDRDRLLAFLDRHAATMPRTALRFAIEHLDAPTRKHYRDLARDA